MTTVEMKDVLYNKLKDEGCYFKKSDISIRRKKNGYTVIIKDYEHIPFTITEDIDDYFGYILYVDREYNLDFIDSKNGFDYFTAMLRLGYYIGTRF